MSLRPELLFGTGQAGGGAGVDYRLTRRAVLQQFRLGRLSRSDVCDAHPELMRAAKNCGTPTALDCPVCRRANVVLLTYAFGPRLPSGGRILTDARDLADLRERVGDFTCYVVEVCPECFWNHLARTFLIGREAPDAPDSDALEAQKPEARSQR